jgi:hypothetical protein
MSDLDVTIKLAFLVCHNAVENLVLFCSDLAVNHLFGLYVKLTVIFCLKKHSPWHILVSTRGCGSGGGGGGVNHIVYFIY